MVAVPYMNRGWHGDKTQPIAMSHMTDPDSASTIAGTSHYGCYIPSFFPILPNGDYLIAFERRMSSTVDNRSPGMICVRSSDKAHTWGTPKEMYDLGAAYDQTTVGAMAWINGISCGLHRATGRLHVLFSRSFGTPDDDAQQKRLYSMYSDDNGVTWSTPVEQTACNPGLTYPWINPGPNTIVCMRYGPYAGYLVAAINTKAAAYTGGATARLVYSADNGVTWLPGAALNSGDSLNAGTSESALIEFGTSGAILINTRFNSQNPSRQYTRGQQIVTDFTTGTIPAMATVNDVSGNAVATLPCNWSMSVDDEGTIYIAGPLQSTLRAQVGMWYSLSTDRDGSGLPTFRRGSVLDYGYSGYSTQLFDPATNELVIAVEKTMDFGNWGDSRNYTDIIRLNKSRAQSTPTTVYDTIIYDFNERSSGLTTNFLGLDRGTHDNRWLGGAGASFNSRGLVFDGVSAGITLAQDQYSGTTIAGGPFSFGLYDFTIEVPAILPVAAGNTTQVFYDGGGGTGRSAWFTVTHRVNTSFSDGTTTAVNSGARVINDGTRHWIAITGNRADGKIRVYIDGTLDSTSALSLDPTKLIINTGKTVCGGTNAGGSLLAANTEIHQMVVTRGLAKTSGFLSGEPTKRSSAQVYGYSPKISPNDPSTISGLILRLVDPKLPAAMDRFGGYDIGRRPLVRGHGRSAFRNQVTGFGEWAAYTEGNSGSRGWVVDYDTTVGWHYRPSFASQAAAGGLVMANSEFTTAFNFIPQAAVFSIWAIFKRITNPAASQYLSSIGGMTSPGFSVFIDNTDDKIAMTISPDGVSGNRRLNASKPTGAPGLAIGSWWGILLCGQGDGLPVTYRIATFPGNLGAPTWSTQYSSAAVTGGNGAYLCTAPLTLLVNSSSNAMDARMSEFCIWNNNIDTPTNLAKLAAYSVEQPKNGLSTRRQDQMGMSSKMLMGMGH